MMMQSTSDASPLIVAGMHRSGTSFVAALLRQGGVDMGTRLMPAGSGNERGHFENLDFVEFHERCLRTNGYDQEGWVVPATVTLTLRERAEALDILSANRRGQEWGWKDPRTTLFLDFWASVAPNARYILLYREPSEVIDSLFRRGDASIAANPVLAARAWLCHNGMALRFARANRGRCILANVAVVAREPQRFLKTVATRLGVLLDDNAASPFEAGLMHAIEAGTIWPTHLRYLMPEIERLFLDLEGEADFAAGVHREGPVAPGRARDVFFHSWAEARKARLASTFDEPTYDRIQEKTREQVFLTTEIERAMSNAREEFEQYKSALFEFAKAMDVSGEHLEQ